MATTRPSLRSLTICLALMLEGMCSSSINVQVNEIRDTFGAGGSEMALVVSSFLVAYAGLLPLAGRLVDVVDRRTVFLAGVALFGAGCLVCAAAAGPHMVIAGRFVQGAGAALSAPAALALVTVGLPAGPERNRAVAWFGAMGAAGFSVGLVLPGFVVAAFGWRASFVILVPIVIAVLVATWGVASSPPAERGRVDVGGALGVTATLMVALHAISGVGSRPWGAVAAEAVGVAAGVLVLWRRHRARPTIGHGLLSFSGVRASCLGLATLFAGVLASMYVVSVTLEVRQGADAAEIGLAILPQPICFSLLAGRGARLVSRLGPRPVMALGAATVAVAVVSTSVAAFDWPRPIALSPAMGLIGVGLALAFPAASIGAVDGTPVAQRGRTAAVLTTWQNVGGATGIALVTALDLVPTASSATGPDGALLLSAGVVAGGGLAVWFVAGVRSGPGPLPASGRAPDSVEVQAAEARSA